MSSSSEAISEDSNIQITISPESDHIPSQRHEQTPVAASPQLDGEGGVNEITPEDLSSLKRKVYLYALRDMWLEAQPIFQKNPDMLRIPLTANTDDTALHVALSAKSSTFVEGLVNLMNPEDLIIPRINRMYTDYNMECIPPRHMQMMQCSAAPMAPKPKPPPATMAPKPKPPAVPLLPEPRPSAPEPPPLKGSAPAPEPSPSEPSKLPPPKSKPPPLKPMAPPPPPPPKPPARPVIYDQGMDDEMDDKMAHYHNIERLFFTTIVKNTFGPALLLLEKYPRELCLARDDPSNYRKALNMLAQKPSVILNKVDREEKAKEGLQLLRQLYLAVREMEKDLSTESSMVLFSLVKSGNLEAVRCLIDNNTELLITIKDPSNGRNLLHHAVLCRQPTIVSYILELATNYFNIQGSRYSDPKSRKDNLILERVDNEGNNVLHLAARCQHGPRAHKSRANVKMKNDLAWFKEIKKIFHEFSHNTMVNDKCKTPEAVFYDEHKDLYEEIKANSIGIANSGMIVATLVATVAFAAALTVPGDKTNAWFVVFIFTNALALFASSASILSFLSNFTSLRFAQNEFVKTLRPSLIFGPVLLFISVVAMVVAFTAASFLIFDHTSKWVSYAVASMGLFPILLLILFQFRFFDDHLWFRYYRLSKFE